MSNAIRYNIYLTFDAATETALQALRELLVAQVPGLPGVEGKMAPHLSLLVFDDEQQDLVIERFWRFTREVTPIFVTLADVRTFSERSPVLYIDVLKSNPLKTLYFSCLKHFRDSTVLPTYRNPHAWRPHVTLAKRITPELCAAAKAIAEREHNARRASIDHLGLIDVRKPLDVLAEQTL